MKESATIGNAMNTENLMPKEIIRLKRDGEILGEGDIRAFVEGMTTGAVSDEQIAALCMAIWFQGLDASEQSHLTLAIRDSGTVLEWSNLSGPVLDKHSTGGVGDMVSFIAGPIVAACGGYVPMISGRGLGHTGGTLDKLESFSGINVTPDIETFQRWVGELGLAIVGQTEHLAPADQRIYAVRDSTATVASVPLIVSSILGKKLCEGLDGLVMDVKVGNGAFMPTPEAGDALAAEICGVAARAGLPCTALITDMSQPLSWSAGNALEMREVIDFLTGDRRHPRLREVTLRVAAEMLLLGGLVESTDEAGARVGRCLEDGSAAEIFESMVAGQGGPRQPIERLATTLPRAPVEKPVYSPVEGVVREVELRALGMAVVGLGGGRRNAGDTVNASVGLAEIAGPGDVVGGDRPLAVVHAADESGLARARARVEAAFTIGQDAPDDVVPPVLGRYAENKQDD